MSRTCSETLNMNARHRLSFSLFPVKFSQIDLFLQISRYVLVELQPRRFFDQASKETFGMPRKTAERRAVGNFTIAMCWPHRINRSQEESVSFWQFGSKSLFGQCTKIPRWFDVSHTGFWSIFSVEHETPARAVNSPVQWPQAIGGSYKTGRIFTHFLKPAKMRVQKEKPT